MEDLAPRFAAYLAHRMPQVTDVVVTGVSRIHGGASRETFRLNATWKEGGRDIMRPLVLRRDPVASLIETERDLEYNAYRAFHPTGLPVPEPLFLETICKWLDRLLRDGADRRLRGGLALQSRPLRSAGGENRPPVLDASRKDRRRRPEKDRLRDGAGRARRLLEARTRQVGKGHRRGRALAAAHRPRRDPLAPSQSAAAGAETLRRAWRLPHRQFLVNGEGEIRAILDWEMCHLGDPLEDIAWAADPLWAFADPDRPGGMISRADAFRLWQETSGLKIDPVALRWWEIFSSLKGLAIWISAGKEYHTGANRDPILALSSWYCTDMHDRILAGRLSALSKEARA